ncbi:unnamed protein product [Rotaria magnacalcarata]|uniref:Uncharacterized protein n=2 Tax=Rotaria magnacalcarata TaxID=392030 RepID=A0A815T0L1_9BILA|nr:unnamed protein product [Rotaria magnacalcarata]CAF5037465.1 unnamed protein product [Rotaria magnacalcarata]
MSRWPDVRKWDESVIIEQFKLLKDQLTKESALELCRNAHGCGFLYELYETGHFYYEGAFQAYLTLLRAIAALVPRSSFLHIFPKYCPGCAVLEILSILCILPILENDVNALLGELLLDTHGDILNRNDIRQIAIMIRQAYKGYQGTDMGCCTAYDWKSQGYKTAYTIGVLFSSDQFCELMKSNSILGAQIAHEMLKNTDDSRWKLHELLSKYKELISDNKSDT